MVSEFTANLWTDKTNDFNGRIFRNDRGEGIIPEVFKSGSDYEEVLLDDRFDSICFFDVLPERPFDQGQFNADVRICFAVNLKQLYDNGERATEYVHEDVWEIIRYSQFSPQGLVTGKDAFSDYQFKHTDNMQPFYLFRYDTQVLFQINEC